jgi:isopentenyl-diphosphate Delta-isomerase
MRICIVNEKDEIVGYKDKHETTDTDITRVSALWLFNSNQEILIAQRAFDKRYDPGKWSASAAGTVEENETYASNILKEAEEELGLKLTEADLIPGPHRYIISSHHYFAQTYLAKVDLPLKAFTLQKDEVEAVR